MLACFSDQPTNQQTTTNLGAGFHADSVVPQQGAEHFQRRNAELALTRLLVGVRSTCGNAVEEAGQYGPYQLAGNFCKVHSGEHVPPRFQLRPARDRDGSGDNGGDDDDNNNDDDRTATQRNIKASARAFQSAWLCPPVQSAPALCAHTQVKTYLSATSLKYCHWREIWYVHQTWSCR